MGAGFKEQWGLNDPQISDSESSEQAQKYTASLRAYVAPVSQCLQYTVTIKNPMVPGSGLKADVEHRMASYLTPAELARAKVTPIKGGAGCGDSYVPAP